MTLRHKLVLAFVLSSSLPLLAVLIFVAHQGRIALKREGQLRLDNVARAFAAGLNSRLERATGDADGLAHTLRVEGLLDGRDASGLEQALASFEKRNSAYLHAYVVRQDGSLVSDAPDQVAAHATHHLSGGVAFEKSVGGQSMILAIHLKLESSAPDDRADWLVLEMDWGEVAAALGSVVEEWAEEASKRWVAVVQRGETVVASTRPAEFLPGDHLSPANFSPEFWHSSADLDQAPWELHVFEAEEVALDSLKDLEDRMRLLSLSSLLGVLAMIAMLGRWIARRLRLVSTAVETLRTRGYEEPLGQTEGQDEVGLALGQLERLRSEVLKSQTDLREAAQRAQAADHAKSDFLAAMSHEIRTPMNGVVGMLELLSDTPLTSEQSEWIDTAKRSARGLLEIIRDILDFSKIEAGRLSLEVVAMDVGIVVEESIQIISQLAAAKGLEVIQRSGPPLPSGLRGDPVRLRQILVNLLGNAVKFTVEGHVALQARVIDEGATGVTVRFDVTDTGIGIPPEKFDRLFKKFSQVDRSTTRRYGGTGLGLAISKRLAEAMDGEIGAESTPGEGSTFWFTARFERGDARDSAAAPAASARTRDSATDSSGRRVRVLLAEDDKTSQIVAKRLLEQLGAVVDVVSDGQAAVDAATAHSYGLLLMDQHMPTMDGVAAAREIRRREKPGEHVVIVALTASVLDEDRKRCIEAGMDDFVCKPVSRDAFTALLARWRGRSQVPASGASRTVARANPA